MPNSEFIVPDFGNDAALYAALGQELEASGEVHSAATAYDRAFGLAPDDTAIRTARQTLLNSLAVVEQGILFRYIPAGTFLMGSEDGDPDERPIHSVTLDKFWIAETPLSWAAFCDLMDCEPPPDGLPRDLKNFSFENSTKAEKRRYGNFYGGDKIRRQYCEDETLRARDWHTHYPNYVLTQRQRELFGEIPRENPNRPWGYDQKPMIAVSWKMAKDCCQTLSMPEVTYCLPTEAQWEKAARGGLVSKRYAWGDAPPSADNCDFDRFEQFSIQQSRKFPPNEYGLFAMCGGVWEWTADWNDAERYAHPNKNNPAKKAHRKERVLRGGSWADCADAVRVAFRMSGNEEASASPTVGFRLCRTVP